MNMVDTELPELPGQELDSEGGGKSSGSRVEEKCEAG